jgi:hypothetical protein
MKIISKTERTTTGYEELIGHGCKTMEEMIDFVQKYGHLDHTPMLLLADNSFDCGEWI